MLYGEFSEEKLSNISDDVKLLIKRVVDTAKTYYKDPERINKTIDEFWGNSVL